MRKFRKPSKTANSKLFTANYIFSPTSAHASPPTPPGPTKPISRPNQPLPPHTLPPDSIRQEPRHFRARRPTEDYHRQRLFVTLPTIEHVHHLGKDSVRLNKVEERHGRAELEPRIARSDFCRRFKSTSRFLSFHFNIPPFACSASMSNSLACLCTLARIGFSELLAVRRQSGTFDGTTGVAHHCASRLHDLAPPSYEDTNGTCRPLLIPALSRRSYENLRIAHPCRLRSITQADCTMLPMRIARQS